MAAGRFYWCRQAGQAALGRAGCCQLGSRVLAEAALGGNGKAPPAAPPGPDSALPDTHEHPSEPDPEQGIVAVLWHSSGCQSLHPLLCNSFVCLTTERDLPQLRNHPGGVQRPTYLTFWKNQ